MPLQTIYVLAVAYAGLTLLSAALVYSMTYLGRLDMPGTRSSHIVPTPKGGGVGICVAAMIGAASAQLAGAGPPHGWLGISAAAGLALFGHLDDHRDWPAAAKFAVQLTAAFIAVGAGLGLQEITLPIAGVVELGLTGGILSVVWILVVTNAVNFIDGLNGLASGVTAIACCAVAAVSLAADLGSGWTTSLALLAGVSGFLPFNFPRARIFMGDVGSQFCGFQLALLTFYTGNADSSWTGVLLVPLALTGVLFDVGYTLLRRYLVGARLTDPHREHLYQMAQRSGLSATKVAALHLLFAAWGVCCYLALSFLAAWWQPVWLILALIPQFVWLGTVRRWTADVGLPNLRLQWRKRAT